MCVRERVRERAWERVGGGDGEREGAYQVDENEEKAAHAVLDACGVRADLPVADSDDDGECQGAS